MSSLSAKLSARINQRHKVSNQSSVQTQSYVIYRGPHMSADWNPLVHIYTKIWRVVGIYRFGHSSNIISESQCGNMEYICMNAAPYYFQCTLWMLVQPIMCEAKWCTRCPDSENRRDKRPMHWVRQPHWTEPLPGIRHVWPKHKYTYKYIASRTWSHQTSSSNE